MANLITASRLVLLVVVVWIAYLPPTPWQFINVVLIILIFVSDGLDGYVARKRREESLFGALFDIAGDRIVELTLWIVCADLDLVPIWVPLVFIVRGTIVDTIRSSESTSQQTSPFGLMKSRWGKALVAGKFMRIFYAVMKAHAFCSLMLIYPIPALYPGIWADYGTFLNIFAGFFVYISVLLCLARGLPVVAEFLRAQRQQPS